MATPLLGAEGLHLEYPTRVVFDSLSVGIEEGDRIGIVGRNGDGKSSLLGMLSGQIEPQAGRVTRRGGVRFGVLGQSDDLDPEATVGYSIAGDAPAVHLACTRLTVPVVDEFVADLKEAVAHSRTKPAQPGTMATVYGLGQSAAVGPMLIGDMATRLRSVKGPTSRGRSRFGWSWLM